MSAQVLSSWTSHRRAVTRSRRRKRVRVPSREFVARRDEVHAGGAAAQSHEFGRKRNLVEVVQIKVAIPEPDAGKHWVVLAISAVPWRCEAHCPLSRAREESARSLGRRGKVQDGAKSMRRTALHSGCAGPARRGFPSPECWECHLCFFPGTGQRRLRWGR